MVHELSEKLRAFITTATLLEHCTDTVAYEKLHGEYFAMQQDIDPYEELFDDEAMEEDIQWEHLIYSEQGKWGIRASSWNPAVEASFDRIESVNNSNLYTVEREGKVGMIWLDEEVHELFKVEYDSITEFAQNLYLVVKEGKTYYARGGKLSSQYFDEIRIPRCAGWIHVKKDGVWGYLDGNLDFCTSESEAHEFVIPELVDLSFIADPFLKYHPVTRRDITACDKVETLLKDCDVDHEEWKTYKKLAQALVPNDRCDTIEREGYFGVVDFLGHTIIPPVYDEIVIEEKNRPTIYGKRQGLWAQLDPVDEAYSPIFLSEELPKTCLCENWLVAKVEGKFGVYDSLRGKWLLEPIYDNLNIQHEHCCVITQQGNLYGYFDSDFCILPAYDKIILGNTFTFVRAIKNGVAGYFDEAGQWTDDITHARVFTHSLY